MEINEKQANGCRRLNDARIRITIKETKKWNTRNLKSSILKAGLNG